MTTIDKAFLAAILLTAGVAGTSAAQPPEPMPGPDPMPAPEPAPSPSAEEEIECPTFVRGAKLKISEVDGGVVFEVTTATSAYVPELRNMLHELATVVEQHAESTSQDPEALDLPPLDIAVREIPTGARVTVRTEGGDNVAQVREHAREVEQFWQSSTCINGHAADADAVTSRRRAR